MFMAKGKRAIQVDKLSKLKWADKNSLKAIVMDKTGVKY